MNEYNINKQVVIWGTGKNGELFIKKFSSLGVAFFIGESTENDSEKEILSLGYKIVGEEVLFHNIENYFIIVASLDYKRIEKKLTEMGFREGEEFVSFRQICDCPSEKDYVSDLEKKVSELKGKKHNNLLLFHLTEYDAVKQGVNDFFVRLSERLSNDLLLVQEATWLYDETENFMNIPFIIAPHVMGRGKYVSAKGFFICDGTLVSNSQYTISSYWKDNCKQQGLEYYARNLRMKYPDMVDNNEYLIACLTREYIEKLVNYYRPEYIFCWNEFYALHGIAISVAEAVGISVRFIEFGNVPGTIQFDRIGQMGESYIARNPEWFRTMPVSNYEIESAKEVWRYLYSSRLNRKKQKNNSDYIKSIIETKGSRKIVLYAGQNDYESGIAPYDEKSRNYHSPSFESSIEAALYLNEVCRSNDYIFLFKPHPMMLESMSVEEMTNLGEKMTVLEDADINDAVDIADVVVTILSTTAYVSLVRKRATLMLGYTQLKGSGCTYEAFSRDEIEPQLHAAMVNGFTSEQEKEFCDHIARMNKYYCYSIGARSNDDLMYDRSIDSFNVDDIF